MSRILIISTFEASESVIIKSYLFKVNLFKKILNKRLRSAEEGADTILWLATTHDYPNGKFWFDRKQVKTTILNFNRSSKKEDEVLWKHCESIFASLKGSSP